MLAGKKKKRWRPLPGAKQRESAKMVPGIEQASRCVLSQLPAPQALALRLATGSLGASGQGPLRWALGW